ncbi:hypothetical protein TVAGG3_0575510, partial [Trichomonas vaginalis G3]
MSDVPPTESNLNPEEPKAPAPAPQFQQFQSQSKLLPISTSRLLPTTRLPELPSSAYALLPQPLDVPASSTPIQIPISVQERPRLRRRSEPLTQRVCYSSNPWMFMQKPAPQFQSQSKRDQDFEEGLNRLRKEYATAPI